MAKARSLESKLAKLRSLRNSPSSPQLVHELRTALGDTSNMVVAEAAAIAGEFRQAELTGDLVATFDRLLDEPLKTDKLCRAKIAIVEALNQMEFDDDDFFWRGARYVQAEPVWGGSQDTAVPVRVACAFALVRIRAHGTLPYLVDLLCDPEKGARAGAAQALAYSETDAALFLLRLKARVGDRDAEVISECFNGVLKLAPDDGMTFVVEFLNARDLAVQEAAVLALGESRRPQAFEALKKFWRTQVESRLQETILVALTLLRLPAATDFLLELVANESEAVAAAALAALVRHRYDDRLRERIAAAVARNGRPALQTYFDKRFTVEE
jgi:HEAT repeat protein